MDNQITISYMQVMYIYLSMWLFILIVLMIHDWCKKIIKYYKMFLRYAPLVVLFRPIWIVLVIKDNR